MKAPTPVYNKIYPSFFAVNLLHYKKCQSVMKNYRYRKDDHTITCIDIVVQLLADNDRKSDIDRISIKDARKRLRHNRYKLNIPSELTFYLSKSDKKTEQQRNATALPFASSISNKSACCSSVRTIASLSPRSSPVALRKILTALSSEIFITQIYSQFFTIWHSYDCFRETQDYICRNCPFNRDS